MRFSGARDSAVFILANLSIVISTHITVSLIRDFGKMCFSYRKNNVLYFNFSNNWLELRSEYLIP